MSWYLKYHRQSQDNPLYFAESFTKRQARMDILLTTSWKDWLIIVRGNNIPVKRGENAMSEETFAIRRKWSRGKVRRFLNYLETIQQIVQQKSKVKSIITVLNREKYQWNGTSDDTTDSTTDGHQTVQQTDTIKKVKKVKKVKEGKEIDPPNTKFYSQMFFSTEQEYLKLKEDFGGANLDKMLDSYDAYIINKQNWKNYKSPYLAVRNRLQKEADKGAINIPMKSKQRNDMSFDERQKEEQKNKSSKTFYKSLIQKWLQ